MSNWDPFAKVQRLKKANPTRPFDSKQERLPPGQYLTEKFPILHYGGVPKFDPQTWDFKIWGLVEKPIRLSWGEFVKLPTIEVITDIHCVTRWSKFDTKWRGVPWHWVMETAQPKPEAQYIPHLYFWKSAKWLRGIEFMSTDRAGFWEGYGYHMHGDPWRSERFAE
ncbi:MAG: sulfite oxidase-like oxidoreductase [Chloroflexi bacterium]|nr:MAG: sulfite oxidase-like oxidoreductase [Chloroflexota bacterium]